jgi:transcription elongation factor B subunit 1
MASDNQSLSKYVTLISSDGFEFVVLREAACISGAIKRMLDPQSECSPPTLFCVCDVLTPTIQVNSRNLSTDDAILKKSSTLIYPSVVLSSHSSQPNALQSPYASVIRSNTRRLVSDGQEKAFLRTVAEHRSMIIAKLAHRTFLFFF